MRPKEFDIDPTDVDTNGLCAAIDGAGPWTLAGDSEFVAESAGDGLAHKLNLTSGTDVSNITFTLTGTDADDNVLTEARVGPNATTVESLKYFKTLTGVAASISLAAETLDIGWVDEIQTKTIPLNWRATDAATYAVDVSGTISYTVQEMFGPAQQSLPTQNASWHNLSALAAKTADLVSAGTDNATGIRLQVNSYSSGAEIQLHVAQN